MSSRHVFVLILLLLLATRSSTNAGTLRHSYRLSEGLADELGGPALVAHGGRTTGFGYAFAPNQGLSLIGGIDSASYSIELVFELSAISGYRKLIDFKDLSVDAGMYVLSGVPRFYTASGGVTAIAIDTLQHLVVTRDGETNEFRAYLNGETSFSFIDSSDAAVFSGAGGIAHFLRDDFATSENEASGGIARLIRIYDGPVDESAAVSLYQIWQVPEPNWLVSLLTVGLMLPNCRSRFLDSRH